MKMKRRSKLVLSLLRNIRSLNDEVDIEFRWSDVQEEDEEDIALVNFIENYKSKLWGKFSKKKLLDDCLMIAVLYLIKKKIFFAVIFNTKIFYIKFCSIKLPTTKILPSSQDETRQRGGTRQCRIHYIFLFNAEILLIINLFNINNYIFN